jgi:hypothetical protein
VVAGHATITGGVRGPWGADGGDADVPDGPGVDTARPVGVDGDAGAARFGGEVDGVRLERGLGGGVGVAADHAGRVGGDRAGDVDDAAPAGVEHAGQHGRCRAAAVLLIGQVGGHDADPPGGHAPPAQQGAGLLQLRRGPREQDHAGAGVGQPERDGPADAAPGTGDQCGLAGEVSCHCGLLNG